MSTTSENLHPREPDGKDLMNKLQVAQMLGKSVRTIDNWRKYLGLPSHMVGHAVFFKRGEVLAFIQKFPGSRESRAFAVSGGWGMEGRRLKAEG